MLWESVPGTERRIGLGTELLGFPQKAGVLSSFPCARRKEILVSTRSGWLRGTRSSLRKRFGLFCFVRSGSYSLSRIERLDDERERFALHVGHDAIQRDDDEEYRGSWRIADRISNRLRFVDLSVDKNQRGRWKRSTCRDAIARPEVLHDRSKNLDLGAAFTQHPGYARSNDVTEAVALADPPSRGGNGSL